jgi:hypothetical protein
MITFEQSFSNSSALFFPHNARTGYVQSFCSEGTEKRHVGAALYLPDV